MPSKKLGTMKHEKGERAKENTEGGDKRQGTASAQKMKENHVTFWEYHNGRRLDRVEGLQGIGRGTFEIWFRQMDDHVAKLLLTCSIAVCTGWGYVVKVFPTWIIGGKNPTLIELQRKSLTRLGFSLKHYSQYVKCG